jgi:arylsulfatase A-like enzyme
MVFSSDNGGMPVYGGYNWPLRGCKNTLLEGGVRAAAFVSGEMIEKKSRICKELMHVTDWFPTLTSLAGGTA